MTVSTTTNKISYIGNGIAKEFAVPFPFLETNHLKVYQLLNDIQTNRTDWIISDGNIVFTTAPSQGAQVVIMREVPFTQETDYREHEILSAETLERNFDALTMQVQQLKEQTDRAVTIDVFDDTQASELLPSIRTAVSAAAGYANTAQEKLTAAAEQAVNAAQSAQTAKEQAALATAMASEASVVLSGRATTGLDNLSAAGKKVASNMAMPSDQYIELTLGASGTVYTAPADGYVVFDAYATAPQSVISLLTHPLGINTICTPGGNGNPYLRVFLPVSSGGQFRAEYIAADFSDSNGYLFRFYYAKGAC